MDTATVQRALIARGFDLGKGGPSGKGDDGALGRLTIAAVTAFQKAEKLPILYPGTIGPKTIAALGISTAVPVAPAWIAEARRYLGLHERKDAARLDKALRLDASEIPWCGAFVGMVVAATLPKEVLPTNPLGARNWLKFGSEIKEPQVGAVAVFWRGTKGGWSGHVGFVVGHDKTHLHILGGNQSDSVSVARIAKDRLLGYRWPITAPDAPLGNLAMSAINASVTTNEA